MGIRCRPERLSTESRERIQAEYTDFRSAYVHLLVSTDWRYLRRSAVMQGWVYRWRDITDPHARMAAALLGWPTSVTWSLVLDYDSLKVAMALEDRQAVFQRIDRIRARV